MDRDLIEEAMALALDLSYNEFRGASPVAVTDAWLQESLAAMPYDDPSGADPDGFVTVGELHNVREDLTGFVLVNPDTKAVTIAWSHDFAAWWTEPTRREAPGRARRGRPDGYDR